ncbi:hypothetical protein [Marinicrinis sediminis]|uniref:Uncharacterized protein n=1 Tax=Marinicrinis sediminis TaxID=1652465 RepID=A0ABW5R526_9BACL
MKIDNFIEADGFAYYYECSLPNIQLKMQLKGHYSSIPMISNMKLYGLPVYSRTRFLAFFKMRELLGYGEEELYSFSPIHFSSFDEGCRYLKGKLEDGESIITAGTTYFLPYSEDYENPNYLEKFSQPDSLFQVMDHWLSVYGMEDPYIYVYDPIPHKQKGPISVRDFEAFWQGNRAIPALQDKPGIDKLQSFTAYDLNIKIPLRSREAYQSYLFHILRQLVTEYRRGAVIHYRNEDYYFGYRASEQLLTDLQKTYLDDPNRLIDHMDRVFNTRWNRYYTIHFMEECAKTFGEVYQPFAAEIKSITKDWEKAHKLFVLYTNQKKTGKYSFDQIIQKIQKINQREWTLYDSLHEKTKEVI